MRVGNYNRPPSQHDAQLDGQRPLLLQLRANMKTITLVIGYAAVAVGTTFMLPQVLKSWKTKRVDDLSFASVTLYFANSLLWLAYGILIAAWPVAVANALALVISIVQLSLKLKYTLQPSPIVQVRHAAAWVADLERARAFYERWFSATAGTRYSSSKRNFRSYFLSLGCGARLELMTSPGEAPRHAHLALSVGCRDAVDQLVKEMEAAGVRILSAPRVTGDGYYEALVTDSEGNLLEITI
jgi:lactoylglutathione lyase